MTSRLPAFASGQPCRSIVERPELVVAQKVALAASPGEHIAVFVSAEPLPAIGLSIGLEASHRLSLPPPDLVTTLGVLLI